MTTANKLTIMRIALIGKFKSRKIFGKSKSTKL